MQLQYIADNKGNTTAVQLQIPIEDWNRLKKKYKEFEVQENAATIPQWQQDFVQASIEKYNTQPKNLIREEDAWKMISGDE